MGPCYSSSSSWSDLCLLSVLCFMYFDFNFCRYYITHFLRVFCILNCSFTIYHLQIFARKPLITLTHMWQTFYCVVLQIFNRFPMHESYTILPLIYHNFCLCFWISSISVVQDFLLYTNTFCRHALYTGFQ